MLGERIQINMKKRTKQHILTIIIVIAIISLISILVYAVYSQPKVEDKQNTVKNEIQENNSNNIVNTQNTTNITNTTNTTNNKNNTTNSTQNQIKDNYVGKEETDSNTETNTELSKDEKVLKLVKETWGEKDDSVTYSIEQKKGELYYVAVKSDATVISWYEVNTGNWTINEFN